ncbi:MAG: hypothetical protein AVDCRST_MAG93-2934, partial [uncultured Chloroflexia bacterium]
AARPAARDGVHIPSVAVCPHGTPARPLSVGIANHWPADVFWEAILDPSNQALWVRLSESCSEA